MQAQQKSRLGSAVEQSQQLYVGFEKGRMKIQVLIDKKYLIFLADIANSHNS